MTRCTLTKEQVDRAVAWIQANRDWLEDRQPADYQLATMLRTGVLGAVFTKHNARYVTIQAEERGVVWKRRNALYGRKLDDTPQVQVLATAGPSDPGVICEEVRAAEQRLADLQKRIRECEAYLQLIDEVSVEFRNTLARLNDREEASLDAAS